LANPGDLSLNWTAEKAVNWVSLSATGGILDAGDSATVTVSINGYAGSLPAGVHSDLVSFVNSSTGQGTTNRSVLLSVWQNLYLDLIRSSDPAGWLILVMGEAYQTYTIQASAIMSAWEGIHTATAGATGQIEFLDTTPSDTVPRFYRAVAVP
jgi:hypothetical protein